MKEMKDSIKSLQTEIAGYEAEIAKENARLAVDHTVEKRDRQEEIEVSTGRFSISIASLLTPAVLSALIISV